MDDNRFGKVIVNLSFNYLKLLQESCTDLKYHYPDIVVQKLLLASEKRDE